MIYYIGDMHLGHKNVIKYDNRPFETVEEMDVVLIENWNSVVTEDDNVYIIGDFIYRSSHAAIYYLKQLKGHKHLIIGNHDFKTLEDEKACLYFDSIERLGYVKDGDIDVVMCHYPIAEWNGKRRKKNKAYHVYSHIHNRKNPTYDYMKKQVGALNAGCMINNYIPVTLEQLKENNYYYNKRMDMLVMYHSEWGDWSLRELGVDYAILYNAWEEYTSKIKVTPNSLDVIESTMKKSATYYMQCVLSNRQEEIWDRINRKITVAERCFPIPINNGNE